MHPLTTSKHVCKYMWVLQALKCKTVLNGICMPVYLPFLGFLTLVLEGLFSFDAKILSAASWPVCWGGQDAAPL